MALPPIGGMPQAVLHAPAETPLPDGTIPDGYDNPEGSSPGPMPSATRRPVGYWESEASGAPWSRTATSWRAQWNTVVFDLRTDLRGVSSREWDGRPINRFSGAQLWVSIAGLDHNHVGMRMMWSEWGHPVNYDKVKPYTPWTDATGELTTGTDQVILDRFPPGSGYQMRYWQFKLRFEFPVQFVPVALPNLEVQGGVY